MLSRVSGSMQKCTKDLQKCNPKFIHDIADRSVDSTRKPEINLIIDGIAHKILSFTGLKVCSEKKKRPSRALMAPINEQSFWRTVCIDVFRSSSLTLH